MNLDGVGMGVINVDPSGRFWLAFFAVAGQALFTWLVTAMSVDAAEFGHMHALIFRLMFNHMVCISVVARLEVWEFEKVVGETMARVLDFLYHGVFYFEGVLASSVASLECMLATFTPVGENQSWFVLKCKTVIWLLMPLLWPIALLSLALIIALLALPCRISRQPHGRGVGEAYAISGMEPRYLGIFRKHEEEMGCCRRLFRSFIDMKPLAVVACFTILPSALRQLMAPLTCEKLGDVGWRVLAAPEVTCWEGEHATWAAVAGTGVLVWGFAVPLAVMLCLRLRQSSREEDAKLKLWFGFVFDGYEPRYAYWEGVVQFRKVLLLMLVAFPGGQSTGLHRAAELGLCQIVGTVFLLFHLLTSPFDNRAGELLDRIEIYGLQLFLLFVATLQLALVARPDTGYDMLPLMSCLTLGYICQAIFSSDSTGLGKLIRNLGMGLSIVCNVLSWTFGTQRNSATSVSVRQALAFYIMAFASLLNVVYIVWCLSKAFNDVQKAILAALNRSKAKSGRTTLTIQKEEEQALHKASRADRDKIKRKYSTELRHRRKKMSCWQRLLRTLAGANKRDGDQIALIKFDTKTRDLVLGLHPASYMHDPALSAYARRQLAKLGPFLSDEERGFIAMSLKDALVHMIVDCDTNVIRCNLLEFLVRTTFVWHWIAKHPMEALIALQGFDEEELSKDEIRLKQYSAFIFEEVVFQNGMTASDFQSTLQQLTSMSMDSVQALLKAFVTESELFVFKPKSESSPTPSPSPSPDASPKAVEGKSDGLMAMFATQILPNEPGNIYVTTPIKITLPEFDGNRVDMGPFSTDEGHESWATVLKIRRLDGPSEGPVRVGHEIMIYSPEASRRLDVGMKEGTSCDPNHRSSSTYFHVKPVGDFHSESEPIKYEQEVGFFSPESPFLRMDINGVAAADMNLSTWTTRLRLELETVE
jgi:hypothetical protein